MSETLDESKRNKRTAKRILAIGLPLVLIGSVGVGYAWWSSTGSGTGSATTAAGAVAGDVVVTGSSANAVGPGATSALTATVVNNASTSVHLTKVVASVTGVTKSGAAVTGCGVADYAVTGATMNIPALSQDFAPGATLNVSGATLTFGGANAASDQNACKGADVELTFAAS